METKEVKLNNAPQNQEVIIKTDEEVAVKNGEYVNLNTDGGVISSPEEIETLKQRQAVDELKNELLGHYNPNNGKYEISDDIRVELREVLKKADSFVKNAIFASSVSAYGGIGKFYFIVKTDVEKFVAKSTLYVCEPLSTNAGTAETTQVHKVCDFSKEDKKFKKFSDLNWENYNKEMYEEFSILPPQVIKIPNEEVFLKSYIVRRKIFLKTLSKNTVDVMEANESNLLLTRIEILSKLGAYGYKVLQDYASLEANAKKLLKKSELSALEKNELLEQAVELNKGVFQKEFEEEYYKKQLPAVKVYVEKLNEAKDINSGKILEAIDRRMPQIIEEIKRYDKEQQTLDKSQELLHNNNSGQVISSTIGFNPLDDQTNRKKEQEVLLKSLREMEKENQELSKADIERQKQIEDIKKKLQTLMAKPEKAPKPKIAPNAEEPAKKVEPAKKPAAKSTSSSSKPYKPPVFKIDKSKPAPIKSGKKKKGEEKAEKEEETIVSEGLYEINRLREKGIEVTFRKNSTTTQPQQVQRPPQTQSQPTQAQTFQIQSAFGVSRQNPNNQTSILQSGNNSAGELLGVEDGRVLGRGENGAVVNPQQKKRVSLNRAQSVLGEGAGDAASAPKPTQQLR